MVTHKQDDDVMSISSTSSTKDPEECSLCSNNVVNCTLSCDHNFCSTCIARWLNLKSYCPVCKKEAMESDVKPFHCI